MELISREEAMEAIRAIKEVMLTNGEVINALYHVPTIESRPKGKWERTIRHDIYECSNCHDYIMTQEIEYHKFCYKCGADMRGEE